MKAIGQWMHHTVAAGWTTSYVEQVDRVAVPNHGPVEIGLFAISARAYAAHLCVSAVLLANMLGTLLWESIAWLEPCIPSRTHLAMANLAVFAWLGWFAVRASAETSSSQPSRADG